MLKIHNTLTREIEPFHSISESNIKMYSCGPTVYDFPTIGNYRSYTLADILKRVLIYDGYKVEHVMNITDVGHLVADGDEGEDKIQKKGLKEGKTAKEIADFYTKAFLDELPKLNFINPDPIVKASDNIREQQELIEILLNKGFAYITKTGIYFDVTKYPEYGDLAKLNLEDQLVGVREDVVVDASKRHPFDFRLWQLDQPNHELQWDSPWGRGFPGWHIECSAMSMKYLGETIDIHTGGQDLIPVHHTNERAQSESATGKKFVNYWVHGGILTVNGEKMAKSTGNFVTLKDIEDRNISPLALRYLFLTVHYRSKLNFTWKSIEAAQNALNKIYEYVQSVLDENISIKAVSSNSDYKRNFEEYINDDLNMPLALAIMWELIKDPKLGDEEKLNHLSLFDTVFGLNLLGKPLVFSEEVRGWLEKREEMRKNKLWKEADEYRQKIEAAGYFIQDTENGSKLIKKNS